MGFNDRHHNVGRFDPMEVMEMTLLVDCWVDRMKNGSLDVTELERAVGADYVRGRIYLGESPDHVMATIRSVSFDHLSKMAGKVSAPVTSG